MSLSRRGFTVIEILLIVLLIGVLALVVLPTFFDFSGEAEQSVEEGVVGAVRSGISHYHLESSMQEREPPFPEELDTASNGGASTVNPFFDIVLESPIVSEWQKNDLTYTAPGGTVYTYNPTTGTFKSTSIASGFASFWPFSEGDGDATHGGEFEGEFVGDVQWTEDGVDGDALVFDGDGSYVSIPDSDALDLAEAGTLSAWINMDEIPPFAGIIHKGDESDWSDEAYTLQFWTGDRLLIGVRNDSGQIVMLQSSQALQPGQLYHVVGTWSPEGMRIYINGQLDSTTPNTTIAMNSDGNLNIGSQIQEDYNGSWGNLPFDGMIDEVGVYDRALTPEEIQAYYDSYQ